MHEQHPLRTFKCYRARVNRALYRVAELQSRDIVSYIARYRSQNNKHQRKLLFTIATYSLLTTKNSSHF